MNWDLFQTYGESFNSAFEAMCNQLFEHWCRREIGENNFSFYVVNGAGGDGGVEAYARKPDLSEWGVQAKWFPNAFKATELKQIRQSLKTAMTTHPNLKRYVVCLPRALTAEKLVKNGDVAKNTEWSRWEKFHQDIQKDYPNLELLLWDESRILEQLQADDCAGIENYWFRQAQITEDVLRYSIDKQMSTWLKTKYVPVLHKNGYVKFWLDEMIGCPARRMYLSNETKKHVNSCVSILNAISLLKHDTKGWGLDDKTIQQLLQIEKDILLLRGLFEAIDSCVCLDLPFTEEPLVDQIDRKLMNSIIKTLKRIEHRDNGFFNRDDLRRNLECLYFYDLFLMQIWACLNSNTLIIEGNQGTGKTHALADYVYRNEGAVIPILIRAKDVSKEYGWKDMLIQAMGLSSCWSEKEIWNALEATAWRKDRSIGQSIISIKTKVLICVDGIDEKRPFNRWAERISETELISKMYPRIHFCFSGRPYAFEKDVRCDRKPLPNSGDVPVHEIYEMYLNYYKIDASACPVLKWSLQTPFSLGLFCLEHQGEVLDPTTVEKSTTVVTKLIEHHLDKLEKEYADKNEDRIPNGTVKRVLKTLTLLFLESDDIERNTLIDKVLENNRMLRSQQVENAIDLLEEYGVICSYLLEAEGILDVSEMYYNVGIQPFFDYLLARIAVDVKKYEGNRLLITNIGLNVTATQMLSLILLEETGQLEGERYYYAKHRVKCDDTLEYACFALRNASPRYVEQHVNYIQEIMLLHSDYFHRIFNEVVLPVCRCENHPLGSRFFHDMCMSFSHPIKRDMLWSTPGSMKKPMEKIYDNYHSVHIMDRQYELTKEDTASGLPLIYAWALTALDQRQRAYARRSLANWGTECPEEFAKLFEVAIGSNDPQMRTDLSAIAMSVGCNPKTPVVVVKRLANWFLKNVFIQNADAVFQSATMRHYGRCIVECAYIRKCVTEVSVKKSQPPYKRKVKTIKLDAAQLNDERDYGESPFDYDLSRYVLNDPLTSAFFGPGYQNCWDVEFSALEEYYSYDELKRIEQSGCALSSNAAKKLKSGLKQWKSRQDLVSKYTTYLFDETDFEENDDAETALEEEKLQPSEILLKKYARKYGKDSISAHQFIHAAAMDYIVKMGWDEEYQGIYAAEFDHAVRGAYYKSTHGSQSVVMSIGEKYTWEARHMLVAYLADYLPSTSYGASGTYVSDYIMIEDYLNPVQKHVYVSKENVNIQCPKIDEIILSEPITSDLLRHYLKTNDAPTDPTEWVRLLARDDETSFVLHRYHSEDMGIGISNVIWVSACMVKNEELPLLRKDLSNPRDKLVSFLGNPDSIKAAPRCNCYITPLELCWMTWRDDCDTSEAEMVLFNKNFVQYDILKTVTECVTGYVDEEAERNAQFNSKEEHFYFPVKCIREALGISDYDGLNYSDKMGNPIGMYMEVGEGWGLTQRVLSIDMNRMNQFLKDKELTLIWSVRLLQEPDIKHRERLRLYDRRDRCWVVEAGTRGFKTYLVYDRYEK